MLRILGIAILVLGFLGILAFVQLFPVVPHSTGGWLAFFLVGVPFYVIAEGAGEWFWSKDRFSHWSSGARIAVGVIIAIMFCALFYFPWKLIIELIQA